MNKLSQGHVTVRMLFKETASLDIVNYHNISSDHYRMTDYGTLTLFLPRDMFKKIFKSEIYNLHYSQEGETTARVEWLSPLESLKIDDTFSSSLVGCYVPRPPLFMDNRRKAIPKCDTHHFTIHDLPIFFNACQVHRIGHVGKDIEVAMVDSGIDVSHPFIIESKYRIASSPNSMWMADSFHDVEGHGTGESLNIFALAPEAGVTSFNLLPNCAEVALEIAIEEGFEIINCSWGHDLQNRTREQIQVADSNLYIQIQDLERIITANKDKACFVFAAGNGHVAFPACMPEVLSVGGIYIDANFSKRNAVFSSAFKSNFSSVDYKNVPCICGIIGDSEDSDGHIILPTPIDAIEYNGKGLPSRHANSGWGLYSGTSAAAPQICGALALLLSISQKITPANAVEALKATAEKVDEREGISFLLPNLDKAARYVRRYI